MANKKAKEVTVVEEVKEVDVMPACVADIETAQDMFAGAKVEGLETTKNLKGEELPFIPYTFTRDGETMTGKVTNIDDIACIQRIRVAGKVETASRLVISANLAHLIKNGAYSTYNVSSAEKLNDVLGLGLTAEMSRKCAKVGRYFLELDDEGIPQYKEGIPHLPVSSLDYLATLVKEDKKTGELDYKELADFIEKNRISDNTSQGAIRKALPKKEKGEKVVEGDKKTDGIAIKGTSRAARLTACIDATTTLETYNADYIHDDDLTALINGVKAFIEVQEQERKADMTDDPSCGKWNA